MATTSIYTTEQLEDKGVELSKIKQALKIECFGKTFARVKDFPIKFRDVALENCQKYADAGIDSFIVESRFALTVWKEELDDASLNDNSVQTYATIDPLNSSLPDQPKPNEDLQSGLKKRYLQKYRGQEY